MAGDWIKMRTDLYRDPKVILMADHLMDSGSQLRSHIEQSNGCGMSVTRNVMRNATVGALTSVWGIARHQGTRVNDHLSLCGVGPEVIDDIADIPGFGQAMLDVGWLEISPRGLVFPHFFREYNVDPVEELREKNRIRQQRYRAKQRNVTVTSKRNAREEKSREEYKKKESTKLRFADSDLEMAEWMLSTIRESDPSAKANVQRWAHDLRLMRERDHRPAAEIRSIWEWCRADAFEAANVLSPSKLRKRYTNLLLKSQQQARTTPAVTPLKPLTEVFGNGRTDASGI